MSVGLALVLLVGAAPPELAQAKAALRQVQYPQALKLLERARAATGTDAESSCEIDELLGVVQATLKQPRPATESFKRLLARKPSHTFQVPQAPRVMTPYLEARSWLKETGALSVELQGERRDGRLVLTWTVSRDALGLVASLEVTLDEDGRARVLKLADLTSMSVTSEAARVTVATRALDGAQREVVVLAARTFEPPAPSPAPVTVRPELPPPPAPPLVAPATPPARGLTPLRTAAVVLAGLAAGAGALGAIFGVQSADARSQFDSALQDSSLFGRSPLSMTEARQLDERVRTTAWLANGGFIGAAVFGVTALVLWLVGAP